MIMNSQEYLESAKQLVDVDKHTYNIFFFVRVSLAVAMYGDTVELSRRHSSFFGTSWEPLGDFLGTSRGLHGDFLGTSLRVLGDS